MKSNWYDKEKKDFFKDTSKSKTLFKSSNKSNKEKDFTPERAMKLTGATVLTAGAVLVGTELLKDVGDAL